MAAASEIPLHSSSSVSKSHVNKANDSSQEICGLSKTATIVGHWTYFACAYDTIGANGVVYFCSTLIKPIASLVEQLRVHGKKALPLEVTENVPDAATNFELLTAQDLGLEADVQPKADGKPIVRQFLVTRWCPGPKGVKTEILYLPCRENGDLCCATINAVQKAGRGAPLAFQLLD